MNKTIQVRDAVRSFILHNSTWLKTVGKGALAFVSFLIINYYFGYVTFLKNPFVALVLAVGCAFIPFRAGGLIVMSYEFIHLTGLSVQVAVVFLLFMLASYVLSMFYGATHMFNINYTPVFLQVQLPYPIVLVSALRGKLSDVTAVICGGVLSFYLKVIRENASLFIEEGQDISVIDVISKRMIVNPLFYAYVVALIALFVIIVIVKDSKIKHAYAVSIVSGIFTEMVVMMLGYIMTGNIGKVPMLILANVVAGAVGVIMVFIFRDLDYERIEKVQFEDDDYLYYVTAIPKIELAKEEKRITRITDAKKDYHKIRRRVDKEEKDPDDVTDEADA